VESPKESPLAMEIDQSPTSLGATCSPPNKDKDLVIITHKEAPKEISLLNKAEKIKVMVKDHIFSTVE
jgi:hypothetical protein